VGKSEGKRKGETTASDDTKISFNRVCQNLANGFREVSTVQKGDMQREIAGVKKGVSKRTLPRCRSMTCVDRFIERE